MILGMVAELLGKPVATDQLQKLGYSMIQVEINLMEPLKS